MLYTYYIIYLCALPYVFEKHHALTLHLSPSTSCSTLAGSTIMLLTLPWLGGLILGRVDIINGEGKDKTTSKFSIKSFYKQVQLTY